MTLDSGSRLGPYEILAALGSGGMGEVYRARDARLGRDVAVKVLPEHLTGDSAALARFDREVRAVAALSHPNILAIHDFGSEGGVTYAVMELLEGETLRSRLAGAPLQWRRAVALGTQLAEGLAAAHAKGIVHRDLKPENIFLTSSGQLKILDFGLARAPSTAGQSEAATVARLTEAGMVVGTVGYMSPEQIVGEEIGTASDIFSAGCVLYEMLSGRAPFAQPTVAETMAAAVRDDPDPLVEVSAELPASLEAIVTHCLEKAPASRFQSASDVAFALRAMASPSAAGRSGLGASGSHLNRWRLAAMLAFGALAILGSAFGWFALRHPPASPPALVKLSIPLTAKASLAHNYGARGGSNVAISRDGRTIAYVIEQGDQSRIAIRALDRIEETLLAGTEGARTPIFSPDGNWLAFFTGTELKKVPVGGGVATRICMTPPVTRGSVWADDDTIYFSPSFSAGIQSVPAAGGQPKDVSRLDINAGESNHLLPEALPGAKLLLFTVWKGGDFGDAAVWCLDLRTGERKLVIGAASAPRYVIPGYLVFLRSGVLFAMKFDVEKAVASGDAISVIDSVWTDNMSGSAHYAVARNGTIVYTPGGDTAERRRLAWVDRQGRVESLPIEPGFLGSPRLSPSGRQVAFERLNDIWIYDLAAGTTNRVTHLGVNQFPIWHPDGKHLALSAAQGFLVPKLFWCDIDAGSQPEVLTREGNVQFPASWSPDGAFLAFAETPGEGSATGWDISALRLSNRSITSLVRTPANEDQPMISPDGRTLAYVSDESGRQEVYLRPFPGGGSRVVVSLDGGSEPVWSPRGGELFYRKGRQYHSVPIASGNLARPGRPKVMFEGDFVGMSAFPGLPSYDVTPDGQRFIVVVPAGEAPRAVRLDVVLGWTRELNQRFQIPASR